MATRCYVMIKENETVRFNYIHNDGYIKNGVGQNLLENYNSQELAESLLKVGDRSTLTSEDPYSDFDPDTTTFDFAEMEDFIKECESIEFFYLWDGVWKVRQKDSQEFCLLSEILKS